MQFQPFAKLKILINGKIEVNQARSREYVLAGISEAETIVAIHNSSDSSAIILAPELVSGASDHFAADFCTTMAKASRYSFLMILFQQ